MEDTHRHLHEDLGIAQFREIVENSRLSGSKIFKITNDEVRLTLHELIRR
jgi:hypothetical protein